MYFIAHASGRLKSMRAGAVGVCADAIAASVSLSTPTVRPRCNGLTVAAHFTVMVPTMFGWIRQSHSPPSAVVVWAMRSLFVQVTVVPVLTDNGLGEYAFVVNVEAPWTIETVIPDEGAVGDVIGEGIGLDELLLLQAVRQPTVRAIASAILCMRFPSKTDADSACNQSSDSARPTLASSARSAIRRLTAWRHRCVSARSRRIPEPDASVTGSMAGPIAI